MSHVVPEVEECPHNMCDGSGYREQGEFDDIWEDRCLCNTEEEIEE